MDLSETVSHRMGDTLNDTLITELAPGDLEMDQYVTRNLSANFSVGVDLLENSEPSFEKLVEYVLVFFIVLTGIIGNCLSFFILTKVTFCRFSYAAYLRHLAVFDTVNLMIELILKIDELCISNLEWSFMYYSNATTCKLWEFTRHTCVILSSWLVAAFSLDRVVAVTCPLFKFKYCTVRWARVVTFGLCIVCSTSQGFRIVLITSRPRLSEHTLSSCVLKHDYKQMYFVANAFFSKFGMRFLLPFVVIATSNCLVVRILRGHSWRPTTSTSRFLPPRNNARQTRLAQSALYLVCAYFVLTMLPSAVLEMAGYIFKSQGMVSKYVELLPFQAPFEILRLTNYAVNFLLYFASFRSFRHELKLLRYRIRGIKICSLTESQETEETNVARKSKKSPTHSEIFRGNDRPLMMIPKKAVLVYSSNRSSNSFREVL